MPEGANLGLGCGNPQAIAALQAGRMRARPGQRRRLRLLPRRARRSARSGRVIGVDMTPDMVSQGARQRGKGRLRQRRIPPRRDRASAGGRRQRRRDHFQLRHQPVAGQGAGVPRRLPRAEAGRPPGHFRHRADRRTAAGDAGRSRALHRLRGGRGAVSPIWSRCWPAPASATSASRRRTPAANTSSTGRRDAAWKTTSPRPTSRPSNPWSKTA